jgi:hypothetical protein
MLLIQYFLASYARTKRERNAERSVYLFGLKPKPIDSLLTLTEKVICRDKQTFEAFLFSNPRFHNDLPDELWNTIVERAIYKKLVSLGELQRWGVLIWGHFVRRSETWGLQSQCYAQEEEENEQRYTVDTTALMHTTNASQVPHRQKKAF